MPRITYSPKRFVDEHEEIIDRANEILAEYERQGFDLTLRQLYYQFVSRGLMPNTDREYNRLGTIVSDARLAGRIDWDHIVDRTRMLRSVSHWTSPGSIIRGAAASYRIDKWASQPKRVEVWIEKDALIGVIAGVCTELDVPYFSCRGYASQSAMWRTGQRLGVYFAGGQDVRILHLGDHDPSGIDMTRDIFERLFLFLATDYYDGLEPGDEDQQTDYAVAKVRDGFDVERLALNMDQVRQYGPPPNPAKVSDSRAKGYIAEYGRESWELDALEPTVIAALIREAVEGHRDDDAWEKEVEREDEHRAGLALASDRWPDVVSFLNSNGSEES